MNTEPSADTLIADRKESCPLSDPPEISQKSKSGCTPFAAVQMNAVPPGCEVPIDWPTTTEPSLFVAEAIAEMSWPTDPRLTMPVATVQRKAWSMPLPELTPTTTEPSPLTALAMLLVSPGNVPRPTMPPAAVQRNACEVPVPELALVPTTTEPSALAATPLAKLSPGSVPMPTKPAACVQ
jgi:hypothetical protein